MRSVFYVAVVVVVLTRTDFVAAFTNADEAQLLPKTIPEYDVAISNDSPKRFLRVRQSEDLDLTPDDEERVKFASLDNIIKKLDSVKKVPRKKQRSSSLKTIIKKLDNAKKDPKNMRKFARLEEIIKKLDKAK
ncbi:RxLR effector protein [Phytophthora megakarya]|uniref:RxLR effector protein n=1 Tax=Phytophthora megakarya TaxID=4795 RepID=A0A225WT24_9STRA|nr:RxLR effector protein [Phytophthora megakarya]